MRARVSGQRGEEADERAASDSLPHRRRHGYEFLLRDLSSASEDITAMRNTTRRTTAQCTHSPRRHVHRMANRWMRITLSNMRAYCGDLLVSQMHRSEAALSACATMWRRVPLPVAYQAESMPRVRLISRRMLPPEYSAHKLRDEGNVDNVNGSQANIDGI